MPDILMRSKLFVPGSRPELIAKALATEADAISIDLEDAVEESRKAEARVAVGEVLRSLASAPTGKLIIVRVNSVTTAHFAADLDAIVSRSLAMINLPMAESAEDVHASAAALKRVEQERKIEAPIGLLVNIESPKGLRLAAEIASADERVLGLQLGFGDLLEPLGIDRRNAGCGAADTTRDASGRGRSRRVCGRFGFRRGQGTRRLSQRSRDVAPARIHRQELHPPEPDRIGE